MAGDTTARGARRGWTVFIVAMLIGAVAAFGIAALALSIWQRKEEARQPFVRLVEVNESTTDPALWKVNWPREHDRYQMTVDPTHTRYGGSEGAPAQSRLEKDPWLVRMFDGYAFAIDFRERRGHAYMLQDQEQTKRVTERPQPGACLHCHASIVPTWRRVGLEAQGMTLADVAPNDFAWPAVMEGFRILSAKSYAEGHAELLKTPDGSPQSGVAGAGDAAHQVGDAHPVSCVDCHDPETLELRVTRPGFVLGIQRLAMSDAPTPHLPSIERWRGGDRSQTYDANRDATRQEMRTFVCAQCHVEYYCGPKETLFYPWDNGLRAEEIERTYDDHRFPDGHRFFDFKHAETGAEVLKAQHPEFETWSQGTHARAGVACADCHMPYERVGASKVSDHWVRSPLLMINRACQTCHAVPEEELKARVDTIQARTHQLMGRAAEALVAMLDAVKAAKAAGATDAQLAEVFELQRKGQWRLDFVNAENSMGFHAPQETARVLGEAIDYLRQGQIAAEQVAAGITST